LAYSISGGTLSPLDFDARQQEEVFLTAGQSLFAVAILVSLSMGRIEALVLGGLFFTQFFFTSEEVRWAYGGVYCVLAILIIGRDSGRLRPFSRAVREALSDPHGTAARDRNDHNNTPP
jgi:cation:H+ antiporter